ncbi:plastocyanin/azurin family copper-binding protein [Azospirillum sp. TSO22-1]|uniref:plastocyanin/azurin family copper-binding protein n=1 Tax=Azospirillum sp. TSO22-1 TaxID=716789 RepID=UPI000D60E173|nr:plastocyanin/azurin family copper-binding protein [Azospirillum sp. TSO22-1]PWC40835.1 hypothetical protein TSO221_24660 [Azospirillum sp. TSO22-1]
MLRFASGVLAVLAAGTVQAGETVVSIANYRYDRQTVVVKAGDTVEWRNDEKRTSHDITFMEGGAASERLMPGDAFRRTFAAPGRYPYVCEAHKERPEMKGEVVVEP